VSLLALATLGGALGLDGTSVGQFMVSRPLVVGVLVGWAVGQPALGAAVGAILEIYLLVSFPTGGSRFPEGATATVVAVGSCAGLDGPGTLAMAVAAGLVWGQLGGWSITWLRRANTRLTADWGGDAPGPGRLARIHLTAVGLDFLRGVAVTGLGLLVCGALVRAVATSWPLAAGHTFGLLLVGATVSLGILLHDFGGFRQHRLRLVLGLALGLLGARFL
jgi:mannose/fructose/N-acetylgalactosamine-specific phosphotransferase system component IIC